MVAPCVLRCPAASPAALGRRWVTGRGEQSPARLCFGPGAEGACAVIAAPGCRWPSSAQSPRQMEEPCCPGAGSCCGNPRLLVLVGRPNHAGILQCGGSLCDFCARLKPGEVSVPASRPPALLCLRPGTLGLSRAAAVQSQGRVNAAFLPQKSSCVWGFSSSGCC